MRWYVPSWNGDIRFESAPDDRTIVTMIMPTVAEIAKLVAMERIFYANGWLEGPLWDPHGDKQVQVRLVSTSLVEVGKRILGAYAPGDAVLTAIRYEGGEIKIVESGSGFWQKIGSALGVAGSRAVQDAPDLADPKADDRDKRELPPHRKEATSEEEKPQEKKAEAAVTVKKPTHCCPVCLAGPLEPAAEVLFEFLTEDERREWSEDHSIVVAGGLTGHRYLLSHRHGKWAQRYGKICHDLDTDRTLHFHDWAVPPEEEVLSAKLVLEHREDWLRVEAALCGSPLFENRFGDFYDGTRSASVTRQIGEGLLAIGQQLVRQRGSSS